MENGQLNNQGSYEKTAKAPMEKTTRDPTAQGTYPVGSRNYSGYAQTMKL